MEKIVGFDIGESSVKLVYFAGADLKKAVTAELPDNMGSGARILSMDAMAVIMEEEKGNQKEQFKIPKEKISRFFAPGTPTQKIEDTIVKALELYRKRQRSLER